MIFITVPFHPPCLYCRVVADPLTLVTLQSSCGTLVALDLPPYLDVEEKRALTYPP
jgi:hypothetical protein